MRILIKNLSNTFNYGSMMMGENFITYINKLLPKKEVEFYVDVNDNIHIERLISATKYDKIYRDKTQDIKLITQNIKYFRFVEKRLKIKNSLKKTISFYDVIVFLGGDDFAETYYNLPRDNFAIKTLFEDINYLSKRIKVIMLGQTIGPYTGKRNKWAIKGLKYTTIYSRDDISAKYVEKKLKKKVVKSRDLAFLDLNLQTVFLKNKKNVLKKYELAKEKYIIFVGTSLINKYCKDTVKFANNVFKLLKQIKTKYPNYKIVCFSHVFDINKKLNDNDIFNFCNEKQKEYLKRNFIFINSLMLPAEARIIIGSAKFTITFRMHAAVSSFQLGKPAVCLAYSQKFIGVISESLACKDLVVDCTMNKMEKDSTNIKIISACDYITRNYDELTNRINKRVEINKEKVIETLQDISNVLSVKK